MIADDLQANGGMITRDDLASYKVREFEAPLSVTYRGYTIQGIPKTSGCVTTYQALQILEQFDLAAIGSRARLTPPT